MDHAYAPTDDLSTGKSGESGGGIRWVGGLVVVTMAINCLVNIFTISFGLKLYHSCVRLMRVMLESEGSADSGQDLKGNRTGSILYAI